MPIHQPYLKGIATSGRLHVGISKREVDQVFHSPSTVCSGFGGECEVKYKYHCWAV